MLVDGPGARASRRTRMSRGRSARHRRRGRVRMSTETTATPICPLPGQRTLRAVGGAERPPAPAPGGRAAPAAEPDGGATTMSEPQDATERYTIISSDCHAGGNMAAYEEYLRPGLARRVQGLAGRLPQPVPRPAGRRTLPQLGRRAPPQRAVRRRDRGRDHLPQHGAALLPDRRAGGPPAVGPGRLRAPLRRDHRPQPLAARLVRPLPRPALRPAPDLRRGPRRRGGHPGMGRGRRLP